jgi:hypothetical protein
MFCPQILNLSGVVNIKISILPTWKKKSCTSQDTDKFGGSHSNANNKTSFKIHSNDLINLILTELHNHLVTGDAMKDLGSTPRKGKDFSVRRCVQTCCWDRPVLLLTCNVYRETFPLGGKAVAARIREIAPSSAEGNNAWSCISIRTYVFTAWR